MATDKNFVVKNGLNIGSTEVINSSGLVTSAALGGQTLSTSDSPTFTNTTLTGSLRGPATFTIDPAAVGDNTGTVVIAGNLQVDGTQTTINSTTMTVDDLNITLASGAADSAAANGAGITVDGASATLLYDSSGDKFVFNKGLDVTGAVTSTGLTVDTTTLVVDSTNDRVGIGTTSPTQQLDVAGTALVENAKLKAIAESNTDTAVDVFVYDTRKDSDGGAWRKRTQNTSWYNETLNTSTRGARKEFPCVAVIVAESNQVTIYDGDDPDMPMWMVFNGNQGIIYYTHAISSVSMLNGILAITRPISYGVGLTNFVSDSSQNIRNHFGIYTYNGSIVDRNSSSGQALDSANPLVNGDANDVAMTVLPNAPIDADTELPVPTIAVATQGGVSVIKDDGTVVDITASAGSSYNGASFIDIDDNYNLIFEQDNVGRSLFYIPIPNTDRTTQTSDNSRTDKRMLPASSSGSGTNAIPRFSGSNASIAIAGKQDDQYVYGGTGLTAYSFGGTKLQSSVAYITSDHNTGHMVGDIKLATLSDTSTTNVTGGTQPDRSYNNNALTVNGTITKTAVATGADLVAYSGFSSSNYLEQPYNSDLDFNSGDFAYCFWTNNAHSDSEYIADRAEGNGDYRIALYMSSVSNGTMNFYTRDTAATEVTAIIGTPNEWAQVWVIRRGTSHEIWVNGVNGVATTATVRDVSYASGNAVQRIGTRFNGDGPNTGKIALLRISATAPSAEQIKKIYNDEKFLFQENTKATLYGSSDAVTALAYDDDTELLHVGTSAGRSEFQGLRRINNTTDAVGSAMSASNGLVVED